MIPKMKIQVSRDEGMDTFISQPKLHLNRASPSPPPSALGAGSMMKTQRRTKYITYYT